MIGSLSMKSPSRRASYALTTVLAISLTAGLQTTPASASQGSAGRIAFSSDRDGDWDIYVRQANGTISGPLMDSPRSEYDPEWSPDGTQIVFSSGVDGDFEIFLVNADGTNPTQLTNNGVLDRDPSWSPDGTRIAFARSDNPTYGNEDIYIMQRDLLGVWQPATLLAANPGSDRSPEFSPNDNGARVVFATDLDGGSNAKVKSDIFVRSSDGSGTPTRLTTHSRDDVIPTWSPDGTRIAFTSDRSAKGKNATTPAIWVMNANGSSQTRLTSGYDYYPKWSPDGTRIAFQRYTGSQLSWCVFSVEVANPANVQNLVTGPAWDGMPDW